MRPWLIALGVLGLGLLYLLAIASGSTSSLTDYYWWIFALNGLLVLGLVAVLGRELWRMRRAVRERVFGAKLTLRMTSMFALVAVLPGILVFTMSVQFLNRSIESWFNVQVESALDRGLNLGRSALDALLADLAARNSVAARELANATPALQAERLDRRRSQLGIRQLALFDSRDRLIAYSCPDNNMSPPPPPAASFGGALDATSEWRGIEGGGGATLLLKVAQRINRIGYGDTVTLVAVQPAPQQLAVDAEQVEATRADYRKLVLARDGLKEFYRLTLSLTLLLSLFAAVGLGALLSRRLSAPLSALAAGTRAVAQGDFSRQHPIYRRDELGILTALFNRMTRQLADAKQAEEAAREQIEANRAYLERILAALSSGVLAFDADLRLTAANQSASRILDWDLNMLALTPLPEWLAWAPALEAFVSSVYSRLDRDESDWQQQIELSDGRLLLVRGGLLPDGAGRVVVFDEVTDLVRAQRDAAWGEVAKRLAHEIRNPLTPIQLSAERLAMKLGNKLDAHDADFLQRSTDTIIKQVAALKGMVDAFRDYARAPASRMAATDLNAIVREVMMLYESNPSVRMDLHDGELPILADAALLRQVIHNLVVNAQDATLDVAEAIIEIRTFIADQQVVMTVTDNGAGFPPEILPRAFDPYVTSKAKGSGLGLAVVKRIIEEHKGSISAGNVSPHGAQMRVMLPLSETPCVAVTS